MGFKWLQKQLGRALKAAGNQGKYQYLVIYLLCVVFFFNIFLIVGSGIYFMDPVFSCSESSQVYQQDYACKHLQECTVVNDFTIVAKLQLYCSQQYKRSLIQSSLAVGSLIGLLVMNILSDLKGRKYALVMDLAIAALSALLTFIGAQVENTSLLVLATLMSGFSGYSLIIISYIMLGDVCEESLRQKSSVYINLCLSLGLCMFFVLYKWCNQWYYILILFMLLPLTAILVVSYIYVQQSPNYCLFQQNNADRCIKSLISIAKINKKTYSDVQRIKFIVRRLENRMKSIERENIQVNIMKALSKWKYLKVIICMSFVEGGGNLCFYGIEYSINSIGYSFGVNNLVIGIVEIITTLVVGRYVVNLQRKKTLAIMFGLAPLIALLFTFNFVISSPFLCTLLIAIIRVLTTTGYFMIVMIQTQSFPLQIQSIGAGSIQAFAQLGSFIAPLLNAFSINNGLSKISTMGIAMFLCLLPLYFVPQSSSIVFRKQNQLPDLNLRKVKSQMVISEKKWKHRN